jgi:L-fuculose-phosphate aldolase
MVAVAGGHDIGCARYATFGTQALSDAALVALQGRRACLLANHGQLTLGASLEQALALAVEIENLSRQYLQAIQAGEPVLLDRAEMDRVVLAFERYGR